jgi:hypothetical protein
VQTEGDRAQGGGIMRRGGWQPAMAVSGATVMVMTEEKVTAVSDAAVMAAHRQISAA